MLHKVGPTEKLTDDEELDFPDVNRDGRAQTKSWENVEVFLNSTEAEIRRNEFTGNDEIDGKPLNDDLLTVLQDKAHRVGLRVGQDFLLERLKARALANKYHPVRKFFKELKWDGKERLDTWLTTYLGVLDSDYTRAVGAITLIAAVRRIRKPGVKFDTLLVIEGHQGIGKSTALSDLAVKKEWFTDCASLKHDSKTVIEQTSGKLIVEIPELSGMRKAEVEHVKANLSRTSDRSRLAYGVAMAASSNVFAENALQLHRYGLCVVPMGADRKPQVRGFQKWLRRPSEGSVRVWVEKYGNCNIAIVPGLSNVIVADSDDALEDSQVEKLLGRTPLCVLTRRGRHRYYQGSNTDLPTDLRRFGLNVDLKAGNSIVIVPPSVHESGILYRHDNCDWGALADLPQLNLGNLQELMKGSPDALNGQRHLLKGRMRANSRGLWLNDRLCAMPASSYAQLLDHARQLNNELSLAGFDPLEEAELGRRAAQVWKGIQDNRLQKPAQWSGAVKTSVPEMERLNQLNPKRASDALLLLLMLRAKHSARCQRGETFSITPKAMADSDVIGGWTRERYQYARDLLLQARLLVQMRGFQAGGGGRAAAQYTLLDSHFEKATNTRGGGR